MVTLRDGPKIFCLLDIFLPTSPEKKQSNFFPVVCELSFVVAPESVFFFYNEDFQVCIRQCEHGREIFESLQLMVTDNIPISSHWFLNIGMLSMQEIVPYTGCWFRIHIPIERNFPQHFRRFLPKMLCNCVFKSSSHHSKPVASGWWKDGNMSLNPMPSLFGCEVTSFFRSNAIMNTTAMEKVFLYL